MADIIWASSGDQVKAKQHVDERLTIRQAQQLLCPELEEFRLPTVALVGGEPVMRDGWEIVLPEDTVIIFVELPLGGGGGGGGGSNTIAVVMLIAVAIVMIWNPGGWVAGSMGLAAGGLAAGAVTAAVNGAIIIGISLLAGAIAGAQSTPSGQISSFNAASSSATYNINSSGNTARLYQPEPEGFGKMLITPDYAAKPWAQYINNDQMGYFVYVIGRGSYVIHSLQFGDTVFWKDGQLVDSAYTSDDILVEIVEAGDKVTSFPDNVETSEEVSGQSLLAPNESGYSGKIGPYSANSPGTKVTTILLDIVLPNGLGYYDNNGNLQNHSLSWLFECRKVDDYGNPLGEWQVLDQHSLTMATLTGQRITRTITVEEGRWLVRGTRTSNVSNDGRYREVIEWTGLRSIIPGSLTYPVMTLAVRIKAQNSLSQTASSKFKVLCTRKLPVWDIATQSWSAPQATRSWAAAICSVVKCDYGGQLSDDQIDLDHIWSIDARLSSKNWYYDAYIDGAYLVWQLIMEMCQPMLCFPRMEGTVFSVLEDCQGREPRFVLTPRTIRRGTFRLSFLTWDEQTPDDVSLSYLDEEVGYASQELTVALPESESKNPSSISMLGIVNRNHAFWAAVGYAARNRWRRIQMSCEVEGVGRRFNYGDVLMVSHPRLRDSCSGIVTDWNAASLTLTLQRDAGALPENPYITLVNRSGEPWGPIKVSSLSETDGQLIAVMEAEDYAAYILQGHESPFPWLNDGAAGLPTQFVLQSSFEFNRRMIIIDCTPSGMHHYSVTAVNDDDRVWSYESVLVPPPRDMRGQLPTIDTLATPGHVALSWIHQDELSAVVTLSWVTVNGASSYLVEYSLDGSATWVRLGNYYTTSATWIVPRGALNVRISAVNDKVQSAYSIISANTTDVIPGIPATVTIDKDASNNFVIGWSAVSGATSYELRVEVAGVIKRSIHETALTHTYTAAQVVEDGGPWTTFTVFVAAVNSAGEGASNSVTYTS